MIGDYDTRADVLVVGAGPGGSAAAIQCARAGLRVVILEREHFPRDRPGETLHPGIEPLLEQLGVVRFVLSAGFLRHKGQWVQWDGECRFESFGSDEHGPWRGFQAWRADFDAILLQRAVTLGAEVLQPTHALRSILDNEKVVGVQTPQGPRHARFVIDAAGSRHWLAKQLGTEIERCGPRLIAQYGYVEGDCPERDDAPAIVADEAGWTWTARVRPGLYHWTRLSLNNDSVDEDWLPQELRGLRRHSRTHGANVTWRCTRKPAGPGYFLVGDAAGVLDPASSHGVLRALMSGMMAGHLVVQVIRQRQPEQRVAHVYCQWFRNGFAREVVQLKGLYSRLPNPHLWAW